MRVLRKENDGQIPDESIAPLINHINSLYLVLFFSIIFSIVFLQIGRAHV